MSTNCDVHLNDSLTVNLTLVDCAGTAIDVSSATTQEIIIKGPSTRIVQASSFVTDGTDGAITTAFANGLIDQTGEWLVQGHVILPGPIEYHSEIKTFNVEDNL